jgi:predicted cation transporter
MSTRPVANPELLAFVRAAKQHGVNDEFIVSLLGDRGWSERRVYAALSSYYADTLGMPVPARSGQVENARDAFYYLLNFLTLGFWTVALGQVFYILIARAFPDATQTPYYGESLRDAISWQVAVVIISFPVFVFVHTLIGRQLAARPDLYDSGVRRWLTYLALVIAAIVVLGDGFWFISALLRGELTIRFLLDSLVLLVLGGGVFLYYLKTIDPPVTQS